MSEHHPSVTNTTKKKQAEDGTKEGNPAKNVVKTESFAHMNNHPF